MKITSNRHCWFHRVAVLLLVVVTACERASARQVDDVARTKLLALVPIEGQDSTILAATTALEQGRPYMASRILAPKLGGPSTRTPRVLIRAAEAASGWEGWTRVISLLQHENWLDHEFGGVGNLLVAHAALSISPRASDTDSVALAHARRAIRALSGGDENGTPKSQGGATLASVAKDNLGRAETLAARAFERVDQPDSARVHYDRAAVLLPEVEEWLTLRALRLLDRAALRQKGYGDIRGAAPTSHIASVEASALERARDDAGAVKVLESSGDFTNAFRIRLASAGDSSAKSQTRRDALDYITKSTSPAHVTGVIQLIGIGDAVEELAIARAAARWGPIARAGQGYQKAFAAGLGTDADRFSYADILFRIGKPTEAAAEFARVKRPSAMAGAAQYQRARALLRAGQGGAARTLLAATRRDFSADTIAAGSALYLLGDLESDAGRDIEARRYFRELATLYPSSSFAPQSRFRAALILYVAGEYDNAAVEFDSVGWLHAGNSEAVAAGYWAGKSWKRSTRNKSPGGHSLVGRDSIARARWRDVISNHPASYYSMLAARQLGEPVWSPSQRGRNAAASTVDSKVGSIWPSFPDIDSTMIRIRLLTLLGMADEAKLEQDFLLKSARISGAETKPSIDRIIATAIAFEQGGQASPAISLARRALELGAAPDAHLYRLVYPVTHDDVIAAESALRGVNPALVSAVIRQESNFTPHATSVAGARGLMQVMPSVGTSLAKSAGFTDWDTILLYQPDVNVQLGVRHLSASLARYSSAAFALAAYNAGDSRVRRWMAKRGGSDSELFVERIPYVETRDYVRIVLRNAEFYRSLYTWNK